MNRHQLPRPNVVYCYRTVFVTQEEVRVAAGEGGYGGGEGGGGGPGGGFGGGFGVGGTLVLVRGTLVTLVLLECRMERERVPLVSSLGLRGKLHEAHSPHRRLRRRRLLRSRRRQVDDSQRSAVVVDYGYAVGYFGGGGKSGGEGDGGLGGSEGGTGSCEGGRSQGLEVESGSGGVYGAEEEDGGEGEGGARGGGHWFLEVRFLEVIGDLGRFQKGGAVVDSSWLACLTAVEARADARVRT